MKKNFFRVKQLADQTFLKAEKSEVLNQKELQTADERVEYLRTAITAVNKRISVGNVGNDKDKRMKKCVEYQYYSTFTEESRPDETLCKLFQYILRETGQVELDLASEYAEHEIKVEEMVSGPFQKVLDIEFPNILKHKRNLTKYCLDRDSAFSRYNATKKDSLKDDLDEADIKVEQSRDALAMEMFSLLAKENEFSTYILQLLKLQRGYHESALKSLERVIPELEKRIGDSSVKRVFGTPLKEHLRVTGERLAFPIQVCVTMLSKFAMSEEGLFRIGGSVAKVKRLKSSIDAGCFSSSIEIPEYCDVHVLASTLKLYLRELPEPLLTYELHDKWMSVVQYPENEKLNAVKNIISLLPLENRENLAYLLHFLAQLTHHHENKMTASNIAIVIAPNLLWNKNEETNMNMSNCQAVSMLIELFIKEVNDLFPEDFCKYVKFKSLDDSFKNRSIHQSNMNLDDIVNTEAYIILDPRSSPKPSSRKKKAAAPIPPHSSSRTDQDIEIDKPRVSYYPSGSSTLNRQKPSNERDIVLLANLPKNDSNDTHKTPVEEQKIIPLVNSIDNDTNVEHRYATDPLNIPNFKNKTTESSVAQNSNGTISFTTTASHDVHRKKNDHIKPVAAPRSIHDNERNISRNSFLRNDGSNLQCAIDTQYRKSDSDRILKPEIPARPASLQKRLSVEPDSVLQKTQCSVYSVANKQQPSIVNIYNKNEKINYNQRGEKEIHLGNDRNFSVTNSNIENTVDDMNFNLSNFVDATAKTSVCNKLLDPTSNRSSERTKLDKKLSKSNEKLNDFCEKFNGNQKSSHVRTKSDGSIIDFSSDNSSTPILHTPPSPRNLNKPTQPPPPPPISHANKFDVNSTDS